MKVCISTEESFDFEMTEADKWDEDNFPEQILIVPNNLMEQYKSAKEAYLSTRSAILRLHPHLVERTPNNWEYK